MKLSPFLFAISVTFYYNDKLEWNFTKILNEKIKWRKMSFDDEKVGN